MEIHSVETVNIRHVQIQHQQIGARGGNDFKPRDTIGSLQNTVPGTNQHSTGEDAKIFIVIHDQLPATLQTAQDLLTVPDAFRIYVLYGALSRAWLKEGDGQDQTRGLYCRERFDRGVWLTRRIVFGLEGPAAA